MATGIGSELTEYEHPMEVAPASQEVETLRTIEAAVILSRKFPRNEEFAYSNIIKSCKRRAFAEDCTYAFPRGGKTITGPSINLARECARCWGNMRYGWDVVEMTDETVKIRAWAWDMETNVYNSMDDSFKKLIYRKDKGWISPDERDLRELINRHGATTLRNCLLQLFPRDVIEEAMLQAAATIKGQVEANREETVKRLIRQFQPLYVDVKELETYLGHSLKEADADEIVELQQIAKALKDGTARKGEYFTSQSKSPDNQTGGGALTMENGKVTVTQQEKPKRHRRTKAEIDAARVQEEAAKNPPPADQTTNQPPQEEEPPATEAPAQDSKSLEDEIFGDPEQEGKPKEWAEGMVAKSKEDLLAYAKSEGVNETHVLYLLGTRTLDGISDWEVARQVFAERLEKQREKFGKQS